MTIELAALNLRSNRRIRLAFTEPLAAAAFMSTTYYTVTEKGGTISPAVVAVFAIPGSGSVCELALANDLVDRAFYVVSANGVPAAAGSATAPDSSLSLFVGATPPAPRAIDQPARNLLDEIYGQDLVWADGDMVEDATGDLATVGGTQNVKDALQRRLVSDGLDWDETYGARLRRYVDGPSATAGEMRGLCTQQVLQDDRVRSASTTVLSPDAKQPDQVPIECQVELVGGLEIETRFSVRAG